MWANAIEFLRWLYCRSESDQGMKESVSCNYGSLRSDSCYFRAEECVSAAGAVGLWHGWLQSNRFHWKFPEGWQGAGFHHSVFIWFLSQTLILHGVGLKLHLNSRKSRSKSENVNQNRHLPSTCSIYLPPDVQVSRRGRTCLCTWKVRTTRFFAPVLSVRRVMDVRIQPACFRLHLFICAS